MMSNNHTPPTAGPSGNPPLPGPRPVAHDAAPERPATELEVLETLAGTPVAGHLDIFEELLSSLSADLESTSREQP